jgi:hypothetical protein
MRIPTASVSKHNPVLSATRLHCRNFRAGDGTTWLFSAKNMVRPTSFVKEIE